MSEKSLPGKNYLMFTGIVLTVLGIIAIASPAFTAEVFVVIIGCLLLATGVMQFVGGIREKSWYRKLMPMVLGVITALCGIAFLGHPIFGMKILTVILAVFFIVEGFWKIVASFSFRPHRGWLAMLASGALALLLGLIIWWKYPLSGLLIIGILVGVDLVVTGVSMVVIALTIRPKPTSP
jgi:uncharacterized membrane protein HdeD (DUF308 family)